MKTNETILQSYRTSSINRTIGSKLLLHAQKGAVKNGQALPILRARTFNQNTGLASSRPFAKEDINFYVT